MNPFNMPGGFSGLPANFDFNALLSGSDGPVNWEIARFIALAMAGDSDQASSWDDIAGEYAELARAAEVQITQYCGLSAPYLLTPVEVVSRSRWCEMNLDVFKPAMEPLAVKLAEAQSSAGSGADPFANLMAALSPMLMGTQTGMLVGFLSHHVLGRFSLQMPPPENAKLVFVAENLEAAERDLNVVPRDFKFWLAVHEVVRAIEYAQPGVREQFSRLSKALVETVEIDTSNLENLQGLDPTDMESMQSILEDPSKIMSSMSSPEQQAAADEMTAFIELVEGFAEHVTGFIGTKGIPSLDEIQSAIEAKHSERGDAEHMFQQTVGFAPRGHNATLGRSFCDEVARREGPQALARVWKDEEARPSLEELELPDLWIDRTVGRRG